MADRYVVEIEDLLRVKEFGAQPPVEPIPITRREWLAAIAIGVTVFVVCQLWVTGILLGLVAKFLM